MKYRLGVLVILSICILLLPAGNVFSDGIGNLQTVGNKHNLSISGAAAIKALSETQICVFCHTPHRAFPGTPLWNHTMSTATYTVSIPPGVTGTQLSTPENPPDGDSKLCLSCHDGTVPLGAVQNLDGHSSTISMTATLPTPGNGSTNLGTDLSGHHLISININDALNIAKNAQCNSGVVMMGVKSPAAIPAEYLKATTNCYGGGCTPPIRGVQCSSCHDPHFDPIPGTTKFLRGGTGVPTPQPTDPAPTVWTYGDSLCLECHCDCSVTKACP